jgi:antitoxin CptB
MTASSNDTSGARAKRIKYRAWHRGFKEADLILGPFADAHVDDMSPAERDEFEQLLGVNDTDLYDWIFRRGEPAVGPVNAMLERLRSFASQPQSGER